MGRRAKHPHVTVLPVSSKKQLMTSADVCRFLGGISHDTLARIREDASERFPEPLQMGRSPMWTVEQLERYVARKETEVQSIGA